jgi:hypothetical protein
MLRKFIWAGIVLGLIPLYMGAACGGYFGWPGLSTSGGDAKVTEELSVSGCPSTGPFSLECGLWTYYVNYNNIGQQKMKIVSTYRDGTAPPGVFTTDGLLEQHFSDHVGVVVAQANDRNGDGVICWIGCPFEAGDYTIPNAFCPAVGGTGSSSASNGFSAYCNKGLWETIVAQGFFEETKQSSPGSKFSNSLGNGSNFSPVTIGKVLASSTLLPNGNGLAVTINAVSLPTGASHTLVSPATVTAYGLLHGIAIDASQAGLKEAAGWLASQWAGQPDAAASVTVTVNGGATTISFTVASGNTASIALQNYAGS